jgi:glyoxylase-like metal-dependent hydrolase (beta-lactamase superfamily II)
MQVHEFVDEGLGHSSYVIDLGDGTAAVVDPPRFPTEHEALIDRSGWDLRWTMDTHSHADYVTGSPGLVARRGVTFIAPAASINATAVVDAATHALVVGIDSPALRALGRVPAKRWPPSTCRTCSRLQQSPRPMGQPKTFAGICAESPSSSRPAPGPTISTSAPLANPSAI